MKKLRITRVITTTSVVPFNDEYYGDMTLDDAIDMEQNADMEYIVEGFEFSDPQIETRVEIEED